MSMDDWGRSYVCGNSDPFQLVMYDSRYLARNPFLQAPAAAVNVAPAGKFTKLYRVSPVEPWRVLRTRLRSQGVVRGSDEGGSPSGFFTGGTGVTVYRGDAFPAEFHGNLFVGDVANNVVHRALPLPRGLLVTAESTEKGREFLASRDNGFRPVQMANGPDGCLWIVDMCRELIEGAAFLPPQILKHMDVASGVDRGRICAWCPLGTSRGHPKLSKATTAELVALLEHPNGWHRDTASRLLYQRQDRSAMESLRQLAAASKVATGSSTCALRASRARRVARGRRVCRPERSGTASSRTRFASSGALLQRRGASSKTDGRYGRRSMTRSSVTSWHFRWVRSRVRNRHARSPRWRFATRRIPGCEWPFSAPQRPALARSFAGWEAMPDSAPRRMDKSS